MNLVVIAGIKRSFSTGMYNLVRIALEKAGYNVIIKGHRFNTDILDDLGEKDIVLLKRHPFHKEYAEKADHIFLTDRKDSEIRASLTRFNGKEPYEGRIRDMRKHLDKWKEYTTVHYIFPYGIWETWPKAYVNVILICLDIDTDIANDVLEAFNEIEPPESGQDPKSLLFHNHITSK